MRNASVSIEVSETIYEQVVEPRKKAKTLSKLVATLLQGYISDEYIYSYAEGVVQGMRKAQVDNFESAIDKVFEHSANIGMFSDELSSLNSSAHKRFKEKADEASKRVGENPIQSGDWARSEDVEELKTSISRIEEMLSNLMSQGIVTVKSNNTNIQQVKNDEVTDSTVSNTTKEPEKEQVISDIWKDDKKEDTVEESSDDSDEVDSSAMDAMASLLQDNQFSF